MARLTQEEREERRLQKEMEREERAILKMIDKEEREITKEEEKERKRAAVLESYIEECLKAERMLSRAEYRLATGNSHGLAEHLFGKWNLLRDEARRDERIKARLFTPEDFTEEKWRQIASNIVEADQILVTYVQTGAKVRAEAMQTLKHISKAFKAPIGLIPHGKDLTELSGDLKGMNILWRNIKYNSNLEIMGRVLINPNAIRPGSGLKRHGARSCTRIYGSPKLTKDPVATAPERLPHYVWTTGAITDANYKQTEYQITKSNFTAEEDHNISCIYIEREGDLYWPRPVEFDVDGSAVIVDERGAHRFFPDGRVVSERPIDYNVPDWHSPETSKIAYNVFPAIAKILKPHRIGLHDVFSYMSYSHHTEGQAIIESLIADFGQADPELTFHLLARDFDMWREATKGFACERYIVKSNHDEHLDQAVQHGYLDRPETKGLYLDIAQAMRNGEDPLVYCLRKYAKFNFKGFTFLRRGQRYGISTTTGEYLDLSNHGDQMGNGMKGSSKSGPTSKMAENFGTANVGHAHADSIHGGNTRNGYGSGGIWTNGTATCVSGPEVPNYALKNNMSDWVMTATLSFGQLNKRGLVTGRITRTQVTIIDGRWCRGAKAVGGKEDIRYYRNLKRMYHQFKLDGTIAA